MAMFGKALGNGYAITAVIGRRQIMEAAQSTFISSTFWGERIGPVAALKTLEVMEKEKSWERITKIGKQVKKIWLDSAKKNNLQIYVSGLAALASLSFKSKNHQSYKTLITQEMLKQGYLASTVTYSCLKHTPEIILRYEEDLNSIFNVISKCEAGMNPITLLGGESAREGFKRLN